MSRANRRRGRPAPGDSMMFDRERAATLVLPCGGIGFQLPVPPGSAPENACSSETDIPSSPASERAKRGKTSRIQGSSVWKKCANGLRGRGI